MKILGIDPGFERLGLAVLEKAPGGRETVLYSECFKTATGLEFPERLRLVGKKVERVIAEHQPEALAIETLFLSNNQKTAMRVAEARGVVLYEAARAGLRVFEATPNQVKLAATGSGSADKAQMIKMLKMLLKIDPAKKSDDELDAVAIALTALAHLRS